jgi:hypothetical protein
MKLNDLLVEAPQGGDPLDLMVSTSRISRQSHTAAQVSRIQQLLATHKINGQPVWNQPIDGQWTPALDNAIKAWKRSINQQVGSPVLQAFLPHIEQRDLRYLRAPVTDDGRIQQQDDELDAARAQGNPFEGETYTGRLGNTNPTFTGNVTEDMSIFVDSIGFSGWIAIMNQDNDEMGSGDATRRFITIGSNFDSPARWLNNFRTDVIRRDDQKTFTLPSGEERLLVAPNSVATGNNAPQKLYNYYAPLAQAIMASDDAVDREARAAEREEQAEIEGTGRGVGTTRIKQIANMIATAMGGRFDGTSEKEVQQNLMLLRTRQDYEALVEEFKTLTGKDINEEFVREFNQTDYERYIFPQLLRIGAITHITLFRMLKTVDIPGDKVSVSVNDDAYEIDVTKELDSAISPDPGYNAFLKQLILEAALVKMDLELPENMEIARDSAAFQKGRGVFEVVVQNEFPMLVAWYTHQTPFDAVADVGGIRAKGIVDELGKMSQVGVTDVELITQAREMLESDQKFLVDNLRIVFAREYADEIGSPGEDGFEIPGGIVDSDADNAEVTEEHETWAKTFKNGDDDEIEDAIREILNSDDPQANYFATWVEYGNVFGNRTRNSLDMQLGGPDDVRAFFKDNKIDTPLGRLISSGEIGLGYAAPNATAVWLEDKLNRLITRDEDAIRGMINFIDKENYERIATQYQRLHSRDLTNDIKDADTALYEQLVNKFDLDNTTVRTSTFEMPYGDFQLEGPVGDNRYKGVAPAGYRMTIPTGFGEINDPEVERPFFIGYEARRWQVFNRSRGGNGHPQVPEEIVADLETVLNNLGRNPENGEPAE